MNHAIHLHGPRASLDYRAGPVTARVAFEFDLNDDQAVDFERNRAYVPSIPGRDLDRWVDGAGLLLLARLGWWEIELLEDGLPWPDREIEATLAGSPATSFRRPFLPRDLASCPRCRQLVILRHERKGSRFVLVRPTTRLAKVAACLFRMAGLLFSEDCRGKGRRAGRPHGLDCYGLSIFEPFPRAARKTRRRNPQRMKEVASH